ncbi:HAD-IA family hydrolase [Paenibacillus humicola]|uniref:HAD-IA family hydrolase n=1 Tax=Paenibacillus humicola TaxID=3110540 RepID=UPI00237BDEC1|nr:HAD-IA family hydrolase [Paenibacillus humicola]
MNILWDFDGTLFDTYPAYTKIFTDVLGGKYTADEVLRELKISFSSAIDRLGLNAEQLLETKRRGDLLLPEHFSTFPGVEQVLQTADANVIMTHKPRAELMPILEYYGWTRYFADIVTPDDGFPRKPDPAAYRYLHERNRLDLIIGDREIDILPGKALGIRTCLFQNDTPGADYYLWQYNDFFNTVAGG